MSSKQVSFLTVAIILLLGVSACTLPARTPPPSGGNPASITPQTLPPPTITKTMPATSLPTLDPDSALTFGGAATAPPRDTSSPTPPEFDDVLSFAAGGGGPGVLSCLYEMESKLQVDPSRKSDESIFGVDVSWEYPGDLPKVYVKTSSGGAGFRNDYQSLCIYASDFGDMVEITFTSPDGQRSLTKVENNLAQQDNPFFMEVFANVSLFEIDFIWPAALSGGNWLVTIKSGNWIITETYTPYEGRPYIGIIDPHFQGISPPADWESIAVDQNNLQIGGANFPGNVPVYILLYKLILYISEIPKDMIPSDADNADFFLRLLQSNAVYSDAFGNVETAFNGPFEQDTVYAFVAVAEPGGYVGKDHSMDYATFEESYPFWYLRVQIKDDALSSTCPGAPPQRMMVNQRGYVCTQGDTVLLRDAPARSANVIDPLLTGNQFTVIGDPSCADNWSWWQIQTDYGVAGWIAEGGDEIDPYFICPIQ